MAHGRCTPPDARQGAGAFGLAAALLAGLAGTLTAVACDNGPPQTDINYSNQAVVSPAEPTQPATPTVASGCQGSPTDCSAVTDANTCNVQIGCSWASPFCYPRSCAGYTDPTTCEKQACRWSQVCSGDALPCHRTTTEANCNVRDGCSWTGSTCSGAPRYCGALGQDPRRCQAQLGCRSDEGCVELEPTRCSDFVDEVNCAAGVRCAWQKAECTGSSPGCNVVSDANTCGVQLGCKWGPLN